MNNNIKIYTEVEKGKQWLNKYQGSIPLFVCVLGFTATGLIEGISAAGATPDDRKYTALADAEFLLNGVNPTLRPQYPLPPLTVGASPVFISRTVVEGFNLPVYLFNAGLPQPPNVPCFDVGGIPANCVTTGKALPLSIVKHLYQQGLSWGEKLADLVVGSYLILGECVVGGTTTALALLTGLGINAQGKVNSSHPNCNHQQKWSVVQQGLSQYYSVKPPSPQIWGSNRVKSPSIGEFRGKINNKPPLTEQYWGLSKAGFWSQFGKINPLDLVAGIGDPMQIFVAGIAISASTKVGVMLAGGTQMLAVYALIQALSKQSTYQVNHSNIVVGTTRWVAEDPTGDTLGLAQNIGRVTLLATTLNFTNSHYPSFQAYEQGFVKEGVGAGGTAIASHLLGWTSDDLLREIDNLYSRYFHR